MWLKFKLQTKALWAQKKNSDQSGAGLFESDC